jgi:hypothetical protein
MLGFLEQVSLKTPAVAGLSKDRPSGIFKKLQRLTCRKTKLAVLCSSLSDHRAE